MNKDFDVIVIGTGMAGSSVANKCNSANLKVAIIDNREYGGTCELRGCDPKKVLLGATEVTDWSQRMKNKGVEADNIKINWEDLMEFKSTFIDDVPKKNEERFINAGITTLHGSPVFISSNQLGLNNDVLKAKYIVIATGAKPRPLEIEGENYIIDNEEFLNLRNLPESIIFIGGGYISFEFAHIARRSGAKVTILHKDNRPLSKFEPDLVMELINYSQNLGIEIKLNQKVVRIDKSTSGYELYTSTGKIFKAMLIVHGAGRQPNLDGLNIDTANIEVNNHGVVVNDYLQSKTNPVVYAAGDVAASGGLKLTPVAVSEGHIVASNIIKGNYKESKNEAVPSVVFTLPGLATVGLTEEQAEAKGLKYHIKMKETTEWYSVRRTNEKIAMYKVIIESETGLILGAHLLGSNAAEVINLFAMAIRFNIKSGDLKVMQFAYPTHGSEIVFML